MIPAKKRTSIYGPLFIASPEWWKLDNKDVKNGILGAGVL